MCAVDGVALVALVEQRGEAALVTGEGSLSCRDSRARATAIGSTGLPGGTGTGCGLAGPPAETERVVVSGEQEQAIGACAGDALAGDAGCCPCYAAWIRVLLRAVRNSMALSFATLASFARSRLVTRTPSDTISQSVVKEKVTPTSCATSIHSRRSFCAAPLILLTALN